MAQLNVRERRIEAKIAYTGPVGAGKTTNFEQIANRRLLRDDDLISVEWRPTGATRFRDCDVVVTLVANRARPSEDSMAALLEHVDGVVFVADANPDAAENNRASIDIVRSVLARSKRPVPVVVQVNKTDLESAVPPNEVLDMLEASSLPCVTAIAAQGDGVIETAQRALADIVQALRESQNGHAEQSAVPAPRVEGNNPLLSSLRQVLRETALEQVAHLETRLVSELDRMFRRFEERHEERMGAYETTLLALVTEIRAIQDSPKEEESLARPSEEAKIESRARISAAINETNRLVRELSDELKRRKWTLYR